MLITYFLNEPETWFIPWILQSLAYFFLLKKMGLRKWKAVVPFVAEQEFTTVLFRRMRSFWRPFVIALILAVAAYYVGPDEGVGFDYMLIAFTVYGLFLVRLYHRLAKSFGKGIIYTILMVLCPPLFLLILGLGRSEYTPLNFREERDHGRFLNGMRRVTLALFSLAEILIFVAIVAFFTVMVYMPRPIVEHLLESTYLKTKDITSDDSALSRKETMGDAYASLGKMQGSREKFFPDHSKDKNVVVMEYIIGSNLEDSRGLASANIRMMQDATNRGDALTFVLQAGGSGRWFTNGIDENTNGRYIVREGKLEKALDLGETLSMEEPDNLLDFIKWAARKYPADRYMLVLWDHGGGVPYGYGEDDLNSRESEDGFTGMRVSEIADVLDRSGVKFDIVGFDACLMQDIEIARALEPYADYYLASEETEGGYGWYYTDAFGRLAADPGLSSEEFGKIIVSTYDQFNRILNDDKVQSEATLSFVDLPLAKRAYGKLVNIIKKADEAVRNDPKDFADIGLAAMNAYTFEGDIQIDLADFMAKLDDADVDDSICTQKEKNDVIKAAKACVVYRNRDSAEGANGLSLSFPYKSADSYTDTEKELKNLKLKSQRALMDDVFSIIAVQKKHEYESEQAEKSSGIGQMISWLLYTDLTEEEWYKTGFEDYDPQTALVDIPVTNTGKGWKVKLPEKTWKIIADCETVVYQRTDDGKYRYLGKDRLGDMDDKGHPMVDMDDTWVHINGQLVCYEGEKALETDEGTVYKGNVKARLNDSDDIIIHIEWDAAGDNTDAEASGHVTGYDLVEDEDALFSKGTKKFQSGDTIKFLFDYYDENGKLVKTSEYGGSVRVNTMDRLKVTDSELEPCELQFFGLLTDVYLREIYTEPIDAVIE